MRITMLYTPTVFVERDDDGNPTILIDWLESLSYGFDHETGVNEVPGRESNDAVADEMEVLDLWLTEALKSGRLALTIDGERLDPFPIS